MSVVKFDFSWNGLFSNLNIAICSAPMAASSSHGRLGLELGELGEVAGGTWFKIDL